MPLPINALTFRLSCTAELLKPRLIALPSRMPPLLPDSKALLPQLLPHQWREVNVLVTIQPQRPLREQRLKAADLSLQLQGQLSVDPPPPLPPGR